MTKLSEQKNFGFDNRKKSGPVECLGMGFPDDDARREYFLEKLAEKLKDPDFRKIEGFPIGEDEEILALSDPPYFTACPNPWFADFVKYYGKPYNPKDKYHREPFAADVSEGKNQSIYKAHIYHTKVPHRAIMRYILHYTKPEDVILDGFAGTGMTGVAARLCGNANEIASLGYRVNDNGEVIDEGGQIVSQIGERYAALSDLSPIASFIAYNFSSPELPSQFSARSRRAFKSAQSETAWMFTTLHNASEAEVALAVDELTKCKTTEQCKALLSDDDTLKDAIGKSKSRLRLIRLNYVVWSDIFLCSECGSEIVFWDAAVNTDGWTVRDSFDCLHCHAHVKKSRLDRATVTFFDPDLDEVVTQAKNIPVLIHYRVPGKIHHRLPNTFDLAILEAPLRLRSPHWFPRARMTEGAESRRNDPLGLTHVQHFYSRRNLYALAAFAAALGPQRNGVNITSVAMVATKMYRFRSQGGSLGAGGGPLSGTLYVPSLCKEIPVLKMLDEHIKKTVQVRNLLGDVHSNVIQTGSSTVLQNVPSESIDYLFLDPPFGGNLMYTELNFIWESWLRVLTDRQTEAVTSKSQGKDLYDYQKLMLRCFNEYYRVLKPGRWITVEFSNTQAIVWNALQTTMQEAGFVIASVAALDKKQKSFKAVTTPTAVKQDLVISAYKPNGGLEDRFIKTAETEAGVWGFIRSHLGNLPVVRPRGGQLEPITERDPRILYDRTVAFYVRHGIPVPLSSPEFQVGLADRFPERDGMYFLPDQAAEYDKKRLKMEGLGQMTIWVEDERSAADWLRNFLKNKPSKYQEIQPGFFEKLNEAWKKWETRPELRALLDQYFLCYDGKENVPPQIHSYLSTNFKELRKLPADDSSLRSKAKDRWYVPDPRKNVDVEKLREKRLLEEFWTYLPPGYDIEAIKRRVQSGQETLPGMESPPPKIPKGKRLKLVRTEAVRVGFKQCYQIRDYQTIIAVAHYIPEDVVNGDDQLQMIYDSAVTRSGLEI